MSRRTRKNKHGKERKASGGAAGSTEYFTPGPGGSKEDAELHEVMLRDSDGAGSADLECVARAVGRGVPLTDAVEFYAGGAARMLLRKAGLI